MPIEDLLKEYGQNILAVVGEANYNAVRDSDGHIYTIPFVGTTPLTKSWMMRKDWLDRLILEAVSYTHLVIVGQSHHRFLPRDVVIIPPYYTHSTKCRKGSGKLINLKISMEDLKAFVNIPALIEWENASISGVFYAAELYDEMSTIVRRLIEKDDNIFERMHCKMCIRDRWIRMCIPAK